MTTLCLMSTVSHKSVIPKCVWSRCVTNHQYFKRHVLHRTVWKYIFLLSCFISISNGMFFIEQFESTFLPYFLSISNGMFSIEQFENTFFYLISSVFQMTCSSSNSLKVHFYLISLVFQMAYIFTLFPQYFKRHVLHRTVWKYHFTFVSSISTGMFFIEQFENMF